MKTLAILVSLLCIPLALSEEVSPHGQEVDGLAQAIISSNWSWENSAGGIKSFEALALELGMSLKAHVIV